MKIYEITETNADTFKKGAKDAEKLAKAAVDMHSKADAAMANSPVAKTKKYKDYKKTSQEKKIAAMKKGMPYGRQDVGEQTIVEQEMDVIAADDQQVTVKDQKTGIETKIPRDPKKPGVIQKDQKDPSGKKFIIDPEAEGEVDNEIKPGAKVMMKMPMV